MDWPDCEGAFVYCQWALKKFNLTKVLWGSLYDIVCHGSLPGNIYHIKRWTLWEQFAMLNTFFHISAWCFKEEECPPEMRNKRRISLKTEPKWTIRPWKRQMNRDTGLAGRRKNITYQSLFFKHVNYTIRASWEACLFWRGSTKAVCHSGYYKA